MKTYSLFICLLIAGSLHAQGTWDSIYSTTDRIGAFAFSSIDTGFILPTAIDEYGLRTTDGGVNWDTIALPFKGVDADIVFSSSQVGYATGGAFFPFGNYYAHSIIKTVDGGLTWDSVYAGINAGKFTSCDAWGNMFIAVGDFGQAVRSNNGGATIDTVTIPTFDHPTYTRVQFATADTVYISGNQYRNNVRYMFIAKSTNGGSSWQIVQTDSTGLFAFVLDLAFTDAENGMVAFADSIFTTTNGGQNWSASALPVNQVVFLKRGSKGSVYLAGYDGSSYVIYVSGNLGKTWTLSHKFKNKNSVPVDISIPSPDTGYAVTMKTVFRNNNLIKLGFKDPSIELLNIYPNPTTDYLIINLGKFSEKFIAVIVVDSRGAVIFSSTSDRTGTFRLDTQNWRIGIYHIQAVGDSGLRAYSKVMVVR